MAPTQQAPRRHQASQPLTHLIHGVYTNQGKRARNEDSAACYAPDDDQLLAIVADGMGGGIDGKRFSDSAVDRVQASFISSSASTVGQRLNAAVGAAIADLHTMRQSDPRYGGSGSTLVTAHIVAGPGAAEATFLHIGDSPIYHVIASERIARKLTTDHSYAEALIRAGVTTEEARRHPQSEQLTHVLGADLDLATVPGYNEQRTVTLQPNDRLVLCSDGVSKHLSEQELARLALADAPDKAARQIAQQALKNGSQDNVTVLVIQCQPGRQGMPRFLPLMLAGMLLVGVFAAGAVAARTFMISPTPLPTFTGSIATVTPLPVTSTSVPITPSDGASGIMPSSTPAASVTSSPTPTSTPTNTPTSSPTRLPTRQPTSLPTGTPLLTPSVPSGVTVLPDPLVTPSVSNTPSPASEGAPPPSPASEGTPPPPPAPEGTPPPSPAPEGTPPPPPPPPDTTGAPSPEAPPAESPVTAIPTP